MYTIKEENEDFKDTVIEQDNVTVTFTLRDAEQQYQEYATKKKEWTAQIGVCKATIENVLRNHKKLEKLKPEELVGANIIYKNQEVVEQIQEQLPKIEEVMAKWEAQREEIYKTFNWHEESKDE